MEQHILSHGVMQILTAERPKVPGHYEICKLKTIGWYAAQLVSQKS